MSKEKNLKPFEKGDYVDIMWFNVQICPYLAYFDEKKGL